MLKKTTKKPNKEKKTQKNININTFSDPAKGGQKIYDKSRVNNEGYIFTPYITLKNGKVIHHPTGVFRFKPK